MVSRVIFYTPPCWSFRRLKPSACLSFSGEPECTQQNFPLNFNTGISTGTLAVQLQAPPVLTRQKWDWGTNACEYWSACKLQPSNLASWGNKWYLRSSPTCRISQSILVSSMALRPKGHSCLSSRLLFSRTIYKKRMQHTLRRAAELLLSAKTSSFAYPDIGVLMKFGQVEHVVQCQHPWRSLSKIHGWIDVILWKECIERTQTNKLKEILWESFLNQFYNPLSIKHSLTSIQEVTLDASWQHYPNFLEEKLISKFFKE